MGSAEHVQDMTVMDMSWTGQSRTCCGRINAGFEVDGTVPDLSWTGQSRTCRGRVNVGFEVKGTGQTYRKRGSTGFFVDGPRNVMEGTVPNLLRTGIFNFFPRF